MKGSEFKEAIHSGKVVVGFQQFLPEPALTEIAGLAGFDWVWICTEHGTPAIGSELEQLIRTADGAGLPSIVRVTHVDYSVIFRSLELGATGIMVPRVHARSDVERTMEWVKYPPLGKRGICPSNLVYGYGARSPSPADMNNETVVMLLIEQAEAFDNLEDIVSAPGVDCVMFGGTDLAMELGIRQRILEGYPQALGVIDGYRRRFLEVCRRHNMPMAQPVRDLTTIPAVVEDGITVLASTPDASLILGAMEGVVKGVREAAGKAVVRAAV